MCGCHSYNWDIGSIESVILDPNQYFTWDSSANTVCVDACIVNEIKHLWENGIWTLNSCCGHNSDNPSVIIDECSDAYDAKLLLIKHDPYRNWKVMQWKLVTQ